MKEALLTVSFGTAVEQARQADICAVERTVAQALPHLPAYQAYTSPTIRRILAGAGIDIPWLCARSGTAGPGRRGAGLCTAHPCAPRL